MRRSFPGIERRLAQNSTDLRGRMEELQRLRLAVKLAEASSGGSSALLNRLRASPRGIVPAKEHAHP
jgi:hypothetical protein